MGGRNFQFLHSDFLESFTMYKRMLISLLFTSIWITVVACRNIFHFPEEDSEDMMKRVQSRFPWQNRIRTSYSGLVYPVLHKRYLGIEIPDYVSQPVRGSALKSLSSRMQ